MRSNLRTEKSGSPYYRALCGGWQMGRNVCECVHVFSWCVCCELLEITCKKTFEKSTDVSQK